MLPDSDSKLKARFVALRGTRRVCRSRTLCLACVASLLIGSHRAQAQERGAIGVELSAGFGRRTETSDHVFEPNFKARDGLSAWYRLMPAFAFGLSVGGMESGALDGANLSRDTFVAGGTTLEAFADGRLFPSSVVGAFGRASLGAAFLDLIQSSAIVPGREHAADEAILELEGGPELRFFFAPPGAPHRSDLFLRVRGTATTMPVNTFLGFGLSVGFEG
jgi:hypothetical protein